MSSKIVEELGKQAFTIGLTMLTANPMENIVDIDVASFTRTSRNSIVPMRSPIIMHGPVTPLQVIFEPCPEPPTDVH